MAGRNLLLVKTFLCGAAVGENKLVKMSANETVIEAVDGAAAIIGVSTHATTASGQRIEVQVMGIAIVKTGGTIAFGDYVTASTAGVAVVAAPGAGVNNDVAGINCSKTSASGDLIEVLLAQSRNQG